MAKGSATPSAGIPPIGCGVDHRVSTRLALVGLAKVFDPGDHSRGTQAVAGRSGGVVLNIKHPRQGDAIVGPTSAVGQEEIGLGGSRAGVGMGKVVATANKPCRSGTGVMAREAAVDVGGALSRLMEFCNGEGQS